MLRRGDEKTVVLITGGSGGLGLETAKSLAQMGCKVYELSRRAAKFDFMEHISGDVADFQQAQAAVDTVVKREGRLDLLINNAGFGISGAFEFTQEADARRLMDVNLFGMNNMIRAALPQMRMQGQGRIINLSSVAAVLPIPFQAWYSVSKAAVNAMSMALHNELRPYGIGVCAVMPGDLRTGFTAARQKSAAGDEAYGGRIERSVSRMEKDEQNGMEAAVAGRRIAKLALKKTLPPFATLGFAYKCCVLLDRLLPKRLVRFILYCMYAR